MFLQSLIFSQLPLKVLVDSRLPLNLSSIALESTSRSLKLYLAALNLLLTELLLSAVSLSLLVVT